MPFAHRALVALFALALIGPAALVHAQDGFTNKELKIGFTPPSGWKAVPSERLPAGAVVAYVGPNSMKTGANINLVAQPFPGTKIPAELPQQMTQMLKSQLPGYKIVTKSARTVTGAQGYTLDGTFQQPTTKAPLRNRQVFAVRNGRIFIFTFTTSAATFASEAPAFEKMIKTVRWL